MIMRRAGLALASGLVAAATGTAALMLSGTRSYSQRASPLRIVTSTPINEYQFARTKPLPPSDWRVCQGGDDAYYVGEHPGLHTTIGVFDGVGGSASETVDAGEYSNRLASGSRDADSDDDSRTAFDILKLANERALKGTKRIAATSTAVLIKIRSDGKMSAANYGDSGFIVISTDDFSKAWATKPMMWSMGAPAQLPSQTFPGDCVHADDLSVSPGDLIAVYSDGISDNLPHDMLVGIVHVFQGLLPLPSSATDEEAANVIRPRLDELARAIYATAKVNSTSPHYARAKPDDMTLVLAHVSAVDGSKSAKL